MDSDSEGVMHDEQTKFAIDVLSLGTVIATLADVLPAVAALFSIVWTGLRIYETKTVQDWLRRRRES